MRIDKIMRFLRFVQINVPFIFIGFMLITKPEFFTDDLKTLVLGATVFFVGMRY